MFLLTVKNAGPTPDLDIIKKHELVKIFANGIKIFNQGVCGELNRTYLKLEHAARYIPAPALSVNGLDDD